MFEVLTPLAPDPILSLIRLFNDDPRPGKIDLGVGVYRDNAGNTPVFAAIKAAEQRLVDTQPSKSYLGPEGDLGYLAALRPLVLGSGIAAERVAALQTPGGTGALRLAAEIIARAGGTKRIWLGRPTWPIHDPIFRAAGLEIADYPYFDIATQTVNFDAMVAALRSAAPGDAILLHGACHNPTGGDLSIDQWREVAKLVAERGVLPLIDLAYQGLGRGFEEDAEGARIVLEAVPEALVAYSCDKNFGVYRERVGAIFAIADAKHNEALRGNIAVAARGSWSMPPDHGAAAVRTILESPELTASWRAELDDMRERVSGVRQTLAAAGRVGNVNLSAIGHQFGLFGTLAIDPQAIVRLREEHAVYMAGSGRINIAGLTAGNVGAFIAALAAV